MPDDGFVTIRGAHSAREAIARVKAELDAKGVTVFTKIDHAASRCCWPAIAPHGVNHFRRARRAGTPLIQARQRAGIGLPLKALFWRTGSAWSGLPTLIPLGSREGMRSTLGSNRSFTPCLPCLPPLIGMQQKPARTCRNDWF